MTENLAQLKQFFSILAAAAGIAVYVLTRLLENLFLDKINTGRKIKNIQSDDGFRSEKDEMLKYEKIISQENVNCTWMIKATGFLSMALLAAAALFHTVIIRETGPELFLAVILILSVSAAFCILQEKRWKASAADDLVLYSLLFEASAPDRHTGIRTMLLDSDTDFPLKQLLLEIHKNNPGISGKDLMKTAGKILKSDALVSAFSDRSDDSSGEKGRNNHFSRTDLYSPVFVFLAFGIMIILCFLL